MKVTKRQKISRELHKLGLKGRLLAIIRQHLDYQTAEALKRRLNHNLRPMEKQQIEYWVEHESS